MGDSSHVLNRVRIGCPGLWSRQVVQAAHHTCKQTARIRVCRIRGSRLCNQMFDAPPGHRATSARGRVREQKASGASHHYRADRFTPTSHTSSQIKADEKTKLFLDAYSAQKMKTDVSVNLHCCIIVIFLRLVWKQADEAMAQQAKAKVDGLVGEINRTSQDAANNGLLDKEKYVIPPHLHDLQEADLPETQRGLVISEIAQFRERAAKREREKVREVRESIPNLMATVPSGPKWGKPQSQQPSQSTPGKGQQTQGKGPQSYSKPVGFVKAEDTGATTGASDERSKGPKTDEEMERDRKDARRRDEEVSFKDVSISFGR